MKTKASNNIFLVNLLVFISMILIIELILSSFYPYNFGTIGHKHSENALKYGWGWRPFEQRSILHPDSKEIVSVTMNNNGWYDNNREYKNKEGKFRVLVLGDSESYAAGNGIMLSDTYSQKLENLLKKSGVDCEVINISCGGWGTDQQLEALIKEGIKYNPNLIINQFTLNDINDNIYYKRSFSKWKKPIKYILKNDTLKRKKNFLFKKENDSTFTQQLKNSIISSSEILKRLYAIHISRKYKEEYKFDQSSAAFKVKEADLEILKLIFPGGKYSILEKELMPYLGKQIDSVDLNKIIIKSNLNQSKDTVERILQNNYFDDHWLKSRYYCKKQDSSSYEWRLYEAILNRMKAVSDSINAKLAVLVCTEEGSFNWNTYWFRIKNDSLNKHIFLSHTRFIKEICVKMGASYIKSTTPYQTFTNDPHKNEIGHEQIALDLYRFIIQETNLKLKEKYPN